MKNYKTYLCALLLSGTLMLTGCALPPKKEVEVPPEQTLEQTEVQGEELTHADPTEIPLVRPTVVPEPEPEPIKTQYVRITADGVRLRAAAGANGSVLGTAQKDTLYPLVAQKGAWVQTHYQNQTAFVSAAYTQTVAMEAASDRIESVIAQGARLLGTPYVYGATRYMDGQGHLLSGFTVGKFDCSSLMQYVFKKGAGVNLDVTTRTQVVQGVEVPRQNLNRGDLLFFTNASRVNKTGIERVGHVALWLGDGYILHTASDFAKIEKITQARWNYFICARRVV